VATLRHLSLALGGDDLEAAFHRHACDLSAQNASHALGTVALDGKTLRGSFDHLTDRKAVHVLSAYASNAALILAHQELAGLCAIGCPFDSHETADRCCHGRQEHRRVEVFDTTGKLNASWQTLVSCVARVSRLTYIKNTRTCQSAAREEVGYYPCQTRHGAKVLDCAIRAHWGIENRAHDVRDVTLGDDASRIRTKPGVRARIRSVALNLLRANSVQNISLALYANAVSFDQCRSATGPQHGLIRTEWPCP